MTIEPSLYDRVRERQVLMKAWRIIRQNARRSGNRQSRLAAEKFEENLLANIQNIQRRLQRRSYKFSPAIGVAASKGAGNLSEGFDFLGYSVVRGLNPPSEKSRQKLLERVAEEVAEGKKQIARVLKNSQPVTQKMQCYTQTLTQIDNLIRGWSGAFQHTRSSQALTSLDAKIDLQLAEFERWFGNAVSTRSSTDYRRAMGVRLLNDSESVALPALAD